MSFNLASQVYCASAGLPLSSHASTTPLGNPPKADSSLSRRFVSPPNIAVALAACSAMLFKTCSSCLTRSASHWAVLSRCEVIRVSAILFLNKTGWQSKWRPILLDWKCVHWRSPVVLIDDIFRSIMLK